MQVTNHPCGGLETHWDCGSWCAGYNANFTKICCNNIAWNSLIFLDSNDTLVPCQPILLRASRGAKSTKGEGDCWIYGIHIFCHSCPINQSVWPAAYYCSWNLQLVRRLLSGLDSETGTLQSAFILSTWTKTQTDERNTTFLQRSMSSSGRGDWNSIFCLWIGSYPEWEASSESGHAAIMQLFPPFIGALVSFVNCACVVPVLNTSLGWGGPSSDV